MARAKTPAANASGAVFIEIGLRRVRLKLTLGAMADLEDEFGIDSLDELPSSAKAIIVMLKRLAKAAGETVTDEELREADLEIATVLEAMRALSGTVDALPGNAPAPSV